MVGLVRSQRLCEFVSMVGNSNKTLTANGTVKTSGVVVPTHAEALRQALKAGTPVTGAVQASGSLMRALRRSVVARNRQLKTWERLRREGRVNTPRRQAACEAMVKKRWDRVRAERKGTSTAI